MRRLPAQRGRRVKFACVDGPEFDGHLVDFDLAMERQKMYRQRKAGPSSESRKATRITADADIAEVISDRQMY